MKLLVVCEHAFIRESLCNLLQDFSSSLKVFGTANASGASRQLSQKTDITLVLYYLTDKQSALDGIRTIRATNADIPVLAVAEFACNDSGDSLIEAGARGCVSTEFTWQAIKSIMQRVINNEIISPRDSLLINESYKLLYPSNDEIEENTAEDSSETRLTPRQLEVLSLIKQGHSNKQIARLLNMAEATVKTHCSAIFRELGVDNRTQAALAAEHLI